MKKVELSCVKTPESFQKMKFLGKLAPEILFQLKKWMKLKLGPNIWRKINHKDFIQ